MSEVPEQEERPLALMPLADVESPEVVRGAIARFRRRILLWSLWAAAAVIVAVAFVPMLFASNETLADRFDGAAGESVGAVVGSGPARVLVLDVRRLDKRTAGVHLVVAAENVQDHENLVVSAGRERMDVLTPGHGPEEPPPDPPQVSVNPSRTGGHLAEAWVALQVGVRSFSLTIEAVPAGSPPSGAPSRGAPSTLKGKGSPGAGPRHGKARELATMRLDMEALRVQGWIWRR